MSGAASRGESHQMDQSILNGMLDVMRAHLLSLEGKRARIDRQISKTRLSITAAEREKELAADGNGRRRRKGENMRTVFQVLLSNPRGLTQADIAEQTGINVSSVQAVLGKYSSQIERDSEGRLALTNEAAEAARRMLERASL